MPTLVLGTFPHHCPGEGCAICARLARPQALLELPLPEVAPRKVPFRLALSRHGHAWGGLYAADARCIKCGKPYRMVHGKPCKGK